MGGRLSGLKQRTADRGILMDRQGAVVTGAARCQGNQFAGAVGFGETARFPTGLCLHHRRLDPDLEDLRFAGFMIVLGMKNALAGRHDLHVAGLGCGPYCHGCLHG